MKLKNSALQELYDTIFGGDVRFTVVEESPIDKVFRECDEKLSESITFATIKDLQDRNDILERSNKHLLEANMESISKTRKLEKEIDYLKKDKKQLEEVLEDTKTTLVKANSDRTNLQEAFDKLSGENNEIIKERDDAKKNVEYFRHRRDDWMVSATHAEKEAEDLASQYQKLTIENKRLMDANTTLEKASDDRTNLQEACDKLSGENRRLNARIECLREEVNWYRENLNKVLNTARDDGYESGQKDLWDMLQEVSDYYYFGGDDEFDTDDCEMISMTDIIDNLNVNQFLEAYNNWHKEQKQTWECTLEGNIKINGDLLGKVCGIKIDDD